MTRTQAILRMRCPRCLEGRVFRDLWHVHGSCGTCGLAFEREPGYFLGAMYFSYGLGILAAVPPAWWLWARDTEPVVIGMVVTVELLLLSVPLYRYARVLWLHFDQAFDPR